MQSASDKILWLIIKTARLLVNFSLLLYIDGKLSSRPWVLPVMRSVTVAQHLDFVYCDAHLIDFWEQIPLLEYLHMALPWPEGWTLRNSCCRKSEKSKIHYVFFTFFVHENAQTEVKGKCFYGDTDTKL